MAHRIVGSKWWSSGHHHWLCVMSEMHNHQGPCQKIPSQALLQICKSKNLPFYHHPRWFMCIVTFEKHNMMYTWFMAFQFMSLFLCNLYVQTPINKILWRSANFKSFFLLSDFLSVSDQAFWSRVWKKWSVYMFCVSTVSKIFMLQKCF